MHLWLSHIRNLESFIAEPERLLDIWQEGGVRGLVLGPMLFDCSEPLAHSRGLRQFRTAAHTRAPFDPDPRVYTAFGVAPPDAPDRGDDELRRKLHEALEKVVDRGWPLWIFDPFAGADAPGAGETAKRVCDPVVRRALTARMLDTAAAFPEASGFIVDGPAWGFEITDLDVAILRRRRRIFELPEDPASCARLGFDLVELRDIAGRLEKLLHSLTPRLVRDHAGGDRPLETLVPGYETWLRFRITSLTDLYSDLADALREHCDPRPGLAVCPRTPAFGPTAGYDYARVGEVADLVMPKLYFWQRGYDGLVGTAWRWAAELTAQNPDLGVAEAGMVTRMFFGDAIPVVDSMIDFDRLITPDYLRTLTGMELDRAIAAIAGRSQVVPWVDTGRAPHDGDPLPATCLEAILQATAARGIENVTYFNSANMSAAEWTMLSHHCGHEWQPLATPSWVPPDQPTL